MQEGLNFYNFNHPKRNDILCASLIDKSHTLPLTVHLVQNMECHRAFTIIQETNSPSSRHNIFHLIDMGGEVEFIVQVQVSFH